MQSLDIKRPAERSSRVIASAILIDCPTAAAAAAIPSDRSIPTVSNQLTLSLLFWICTAARSYAVQLFRPTCSRPNAVSTVLLLLS